MIDRAFTKAEARYIPNGAGSHRRHGAPDPHRRPRRLRVPAVPVRRRHAGHAGRPLGLLRPARLRARRPGPRRQRQHAGDVHRRRRGDRARAASAACARSTWRRPLAYLLGVPAPQQSRRAWCASTCCKAAGASRRCRSSGSPTSTASSTRRPRPIDGRERDGRRRGAAGHDVRRGGGGAARADAPAGLRRQRRRLPGELGPARGHAGDRRRERLGPGRHVATATTSSTTASPGCSQHQARANFPFLGANIVDDGDRRSARLGARPSACSPSTASRSA